MNYFIYTYIISLLTGRYELNKLTSLPMCGFIAQLVEHRTGIAEVTGSNPVEALIFFRLLLSSCLNWKIHCEDHHFHHGSQCEVNRVVELWTYLDHAAIWQARNTARVIWKNNWWMEGKTSHRTKRSIVFDIDLEREREKGKGKGKKKLLLHGVFAFGHPAK